MLKLTTRTNKTSGMAPLYTKLRIEGRIHWINLLLKVEVSQWRSVSKSDRRIINFLDKEGYTDTLQYIENAIREQKRQGTLTKENVEAAIRQIVIDGIMPQSLPLPSSTTNTQTPKSHEVQQFMVQYIEEVTRGEARTLDGERYTPNSVKIWNQFRRIFLDFYRKYPFTWEELNQSLIDKYHAFLEDRGYMKSTMERYVSIFRTAVVAAERRGLHTNGIAKSLFHRPVVREQDKAKEIYLTKKELEAMYQMPLTGLMEQVRDVFLIGCYTAQRFSDYSKIDASCIGVTASGTKVIRLVQKKTRQQVVIPILDDRLEVLLKKYDYNVPPIVDVVLNRYIKRVCQQLSLTVPSLARKEKTLLKLTERNAERDGKIVFEHDRDGYALKPRWSLVSSHTARRSAITNMVLSKKYTLPQMMSVSGHRKVEMFNRYVKLSQDEIADGVASSSNDGLF